MQSQHPRRTTRPSSSTPERRILLTLLLALGASACGHDWDAYDPRLGSGTGATSAGGSGGSTSVGGGGTTASTGGTTGGTGGTGGLTMSTGGTTMSTGGTTMSTGGTTGGTGGTTTSSTTACAPNSVQNCYTGPAGTMDIGICKHGTQTCDAQGDGYGPCTGDVKPIAEECGNAADDDCNAAVDDHCSLWAKRFGDNGSQRANAVAIDGTNNVIVVGRGEETLSFGGQDLDAGGSQNAFVVKFTKDGAHVWSHTYGDATTQEATAVAIDSGNNVLVTGTFAGSITFDTTTLTSAGGQDVFIAKLDSSGATLWAKAISGTSTQNARSIAADSTGNVYVAGSFSGATDFLGMQATPQEQLDGYLVKLNSAGALSWVKTFGGGSDDEAMAVATRNGAVVFTGYFSQSITLGGANLAGASGVDVFVASVTQNGNYNFAKAYLASGDQVPRAIGVNGGDDIFVLGDFGTAAQFGNTTLTNAGGTDVFLAKLDNEGAALWARGYGDAADQGAGALSLDSSGDLALAIHHRGSFDFGGGTLSQAGSPPSGDMVVVKLGGTNGSHMWSRRFGDAADQDPRGIAHDGTKNVYVVGGLSGTANFGTGALVSGGQDDVVVAKLAP